VVGMSGGILGCLVSILGCIRYLYLSFYSMFFFQNLKIFMAGKNQQRLLFIQSCTMLLKQIKGFYHGITKIVLLVGSYTMLSWHF